MFAFLSACAFSCYRGPAFPCHESRDRYQNSNKNDANNYIYQLQLFQVLNNLSACLGADDRSASHDEAQLHVYVAPHQMPAHRHYGFSHDVREICADYPIHWESGNKQPGTGEKTAAYSKESPEDSDNKPEDRQVEGVDVVSRNGEIHSASVSPSSIRHP